MKTQFAKKTARATNGITYQKCFELLLKYLIPSLAACAAEDIMKLEPEEKKTTEPELVSIVLKDGGVYKAIGYDETGAIYYFGEDMLFASAEDIDYDKTKEFSHLKTQ